jgi:Putative beta-barrel porin-2, OmpL-like. bbp2
VYRNYQQLEELMKFNKWTLGLAAAGVVSLASAVQAEDATSTVNNIVTGAAASTILSGYVDVSAHWNPGTGNANVPAYAFNSSAKSDGFNLDVVKVALEKPLDESEWASGYKVDLVFGPNANALGTTPIGGLDATDFAIKQAYVTVRTPICNGIDWKIGVFDTIIGYESFDAGSNPNYTRSYGYTLEPTTHTGILGTYRFGDWLSVAAGIANTTGPIIGGANVGGASFGRANPPKAESYKTYMGSATLTAPQDWGFLSGSSLYFGIVNGWNGGATVVGDQYNIYTGVTLATPITGLRFGAAYDYYGVPEQTTIGQPGTWAQAASIYASWQATEKLSLHGRAEYAYQNSNGGPLQANQIVALTGTVQYDLWKNVMSRLEIRWDHAADGSTPYNGTLFPVDAATVGDVNAGVSGAPTEHNAVLIALNLIYKF